MHDLPCIKKNPINSMVCLSCGAVCIFFYIKKSDYSIFITVVLYFCLGFFIISSCMFLKKLLLNVGRGKRSIIKNENGFEKRKKERGLKRKRKSLKIM